MDLGLAGRVALVTGATGGIGAVIARTLAEEGATVAVGYHRAKAEADRLAADIGSELVVEQDLRDPAGLRAGVATVVAAAGRLDVLVASAWESPGWSPPDRPAEDTPVEEWRAQLR